MEKKRGRPTEYRSKFCQMLIDHMTSGGTVKAFAKNIGVTQQLISVWSKAHGEFALAKDIGHYKKRMYYRKKSLERIYARN